VTCNQWDAIATRPKSTTRPRLIDLFSTYSQIAIATSDIQIIAYDERCPRVGSHSLSQPLHSLSEGERRRHEERQVPAYRRAANR
jgi:hypothetical protein